MKTFNSVNQKKISNFLKTIKYTGFYKNFSMEVTCIDQKCTFDTLHIVSNVVLQYAKDKNVKYFHHTDFFNYEYAKNRIKEETFSIGKAVLKPETTKEFDKYFKQIFEMLSYTEIMQKSEIEGKQKYCILNEEILQILGSDTFSCVSFICEHIMKLIKDDEKIQHVIGHIEKNKNAFNANALKDSVRNWIYCSSNGRHKNDTKQISLKILNPIFYIYDLNKYTKSKIYSKFPQTLNDLRYVRRHPRYNQKPFQMTQNEFSVMNEEKIHDDEKICKEKIKSWNNAFHFNDVLNLIKENYVCEVTESHLQTPDIHHIWMKSCFDKEWLFSVNEVENLILLDTDFHRSIPKIPDSVYVSLTFEKILPMQFSKIIKFSKEKIGEYDICKFYTLICYIVKKLFSIDLFRTNEKADFEWYITEIDKILVNYKKLFD